MPGDSSLAHDARCTSQRRQLKKAAESVVLLSIWDVVQLGVNVESCRRRRQVMSGSPAPQPSLWEVQHPTETRCKSARAANTRKERVMCCLLGPVFQEKLHGRKMRADHSCSGVCGVVCLTRVWWWFTWRCPPKCGPFSQQSRLSQGKHPQARGSNGKFKRQEINVKRRIETPEMQGNVKQPNDTQGNGRNAVFMLVTTKFGVKTQKKRQNIVNTDAFANLTLEHFFSPSFRNRVKRARASTWRTLFAAYLTDVYEKFHDTLRCAPFRSFSSTFRCCLCELMCLVRVCVMCCVLCGVW